MNRSHKILSKNARGVQKVNTFQPRAFHALRTTADHSSQRAPNASRRPNPWPLVILPEVPRAPITPCAPALRDLTLYLNPSLMRYLLPYVVGHKGCLILLLWSPRRDIHWFTSPCSISPVTKNFTCICSPWVLPTTNEEKSHILVTYYANVGRTLSSDKTQFKQSTE